MNILKQAHKLASLAIADQKANNTGNLLYSDFLGYYMKQLATNMKPSKTKKAHINKSNGIDFEGLTIALVILLLSVGFSIGLGVIGVGFYKESVIFGLAMGGMSITFLAVMLYICWGMFKDCLNGNS